MWEEGTFSIDGFEFYYEAKVFDEPSPFGIDGGRISKLAIYRVLSKSPLVIVQFIGYDREWYLTDTASYIGQKALEYMLETYA